MENALNPLKVIAGILTVIVFFVGRISSSTEKEVEKEFDITTTPFYQKQDNSRSIYNNYYEREKQLKELENYYRSQGRLVE